MTSKPNLNTQQRRFVKNYIETLDETKSALQAGYAHSTAKQKAAELLKNNEVISEIHAQIDAQAHSLKVSDAFIVKKLLQIIYSSSEEKNSTDEQGVNTIKSSLKDASVVLRAVDILSKILERKKEQNPQVTSNNAVRVMCIENLNEDKI